MARSLIVDAFARVARDRQHEIGVTDLTGDRAITFGEVWSDFERSLAALAHVPERACVISHVGNRPAFLTLLLACLASERPLVLLDGGMTRAEVESIASRFGADAIAVRTDDRQAWGLASATLPGGLSLIPCSNSSQRLWRADGPSVLRMTSGSTGLPRAVVLSESQLANDGRHIAAAMSLGPDDVSMGVIPMTHAYGLGNLVVPFLLQGMRLALRESFVARRFARDIEHVGATVWPGVPFMFEYFRRTETPRDALASLRLVVTAGAPIDPDTARWFHAHFGRKLHALYGTSETGGICFDATPQLDDPPTVGTPLPGTEVTLVETAAASPGEGRIRVQGDAVAHGYADVEGEPVPDGFDDGGFLTGDLGRRTAAGALVLTGRISAFVNIAGRKVHPGEVERAIRALPGIADVAVFGAADALRGERLVACVQRHDRSVTVASLRTACARQLAPYKIPRQVVFIDRFPTDARGKVSRQALESLARQVWSDDV